MSGRSAWTRGLAWFVVAAAWLLAAPALYAQQGTVVRVKPSGSAGPVYTDPGEVPKLTLATDAKSELPLEHTHVKARITGFVAEVEVAQTFKNDQAAAVEVRYIFPLPENSAVDDMRMVIGQRVIRAKIDKRAAAQAAYDRAKRAGQTAALLEQERPNVFTQSVANIPPGEKIDVVIHYLQDLTYDAGRYEFVFPMVVGPRFNPAGVSDAARISPPYLGKGDRTGNDISIELTADAGSPIKDWEVPTHEVAARAPADGTLRLTLAERESIPNRDFVLRYRVSGAKPRATMLVSNDASGRYFSLVVHPPELDVDGLVGQRELVFVVDVSGSMSGEPLAMCKTAMRESLAHLRPMDTFNVLTFSGVTKKAFPAPLAANRANVARALEIVDNLEADGGTMMADAVAAALPPTVEAGRRRYVFFLTDGYVGNEDGIIAAAGKFVSELEAKGQTARVFGFGVGSSPNRLLIEGIAKAAKGLGVYSSTREDPRRAVNQFYHYIDSPVLSEVTVDWAALGASEMMPPVTPDLFASHALIVHGRIAALPSAFTLSAKAGDQPVSVPVEIHTSTIDGAAMPVLATLWARAKIGWLEEGLYRGFDDGTADAITKLGLEHHLVTRFTSLIAVDTERTTGDGNPDLVVQPVAPPEGVDIGMAGASGYDFSRQPRPSVSYGGMAPPPAPAEAYEVHSRRGCGCRVAGAPGVTLRWWLALLPLVLLRRRRR